MDKVFCLGWVKDICVSTMVDGVQEVNFKLKTKKLVGMRDKVEYYLIPCYTRGKKAVNIANNLTEDSLVCFWGRILLDDIGRLSLTVDEIEFL